MIERKLDNVLPCPWEREEPSEIRLDVGRQLFVDNYLIRETNLKRVFHSPVVDPEPVLFPQTVLEMNDGYCSVACPFKDGLFYDDSDHKYKLWYNAGWFNATSYAESEDGFLWKRISELYPNEDESIAKRAPDELRDGACIWIDYHGKTDERYKMLQYFRKFDQNINYYHEIPARKLMDEYAKLYKSADGIHWTFVCRAGECGDNTNFFYNPFRKKWVYSVRQLSKLQSGTRIRAYYETDDFFNGSQWKPEDPVFWAHADELDEPDADMGYIPQLYNLDCSPYESLMLGFFGIFLGPPNFICEKNKIPKIIDMKIGFSRDGFHFSRPYREAFVPSSREIGKWNYGYIHPVNGGMIVAGDEMRIYFSTFSGKSQNFGTHMYSGGSMGVARMRRDGFAEMQAVQDGYLLTRTLLNCKGSLYINADAARGMISVELIDPETAKPYCGYDKEHCQIIREDSTKIKVIWKSKKELDVSISKLQIRFCLERASIYSFWFSDLPEGGSRGYMGAGGPGFIHGEDIR